jgi:hypothetical protein
MHIFTTSLSIKKYHVKKLGQIGVIPNYMAIKVEMIWVMFLIDPQTLH